MKFIFAPIAALILLVSHTSCEKKTDNSASCIAIQESINSITARGTYMIGRMEKAVVDNGSRPSDTQLLEEVREVVKQASQRPLSPDNSFIRGAHTLKDSSSLLALQKNALLHPEDTMQRLIFELAVADLTAKYIEYRAAEFPAGSFFYLFSPVMLSAAQPKAGDLLVAQIPVADFDGQVMQIITDSTKILWTDAKGKPLPMPMKINTVVGTTMLTFQPQQAGEYYLYGSLTLKYIDKDWSSAVYFRRKVVVK